MFGKRRRLARELAEANNRAQEAIDEAQEAAKRAERAERDRDILKNKYEPPVTVRPRTVPSGFETNRRRH